MKAASSERSAWAPEEVDVVGVRSTRDSEGWLDVTSVSISRWGLDGAGFWRSGRGLIVGVLERVCKVGWASSCSELKSVCMSSANGLMVAFWGGLVAVVSLCLCRRSCSDSGLVSADVVVASSFSVLKAPFSSTKSSKVFGFSLSSFFVLRFS